MRPLHSHLVLVLLAALLLVLGSYSHKTVLENRSLRKNQLQLELHYRQEREKNQRQVDSLQHLITAREEHSSILKDSLLLLQNIRKLLIEKSDEKKAAIKRIRDLDSLYRVVAEQYQR